MKLVRDPRRKQGLRYKKLSHVLTVFLLATLSGATSYRKIHTFVDENFEKLKALLNLDWKKPPAYSTLRDILLKLSDDDLEGVLRQTQSNSFPASNPEETVFICFDGKVLRKSFSNVKDRSAAQILSAFLPEKLQVVAQIPILDKESEIPKVQQLVNELNVKGAIITADALHCQIETLKTVKNSDNDAEMIVQVKGNQPTLLNDCIQTAETQKPDDCYIEDLEKNRNRIVSRKTNVFTTLKLTDVTKWLPFLVCILQVIVTRCDYNTKEKTWMDKSEIRYYASTVHLSAETFNKAIRNHWKIENSMHYVRDVTMGEDASRIREKPTLIAKFKTMALNILRSNGVKNIANELYRNALNFKRLLHYPQLGLINPIIHAN